MENTKPMQARSLALLSYTNYSTTNRDLLKKYNYTHGIELIMFNYDHFVSEFGLLTLKKTYKKHIIITKLRRQLIRKTILSLLLS